MKALKIIKPFQRICDFDGPGHSRLIPPNREATFVKEGDAQGLYHGSACYSAALQRYRALKEHVDQTNG